MDGFEPASYDDYSNFFEVTKFDFDLSVTDSDSSTGAAGRNAPANPNSAAQTAKPAKKNKMDFMSWRSAKQADIDAGKIDYPLEVNPFTFSRVIDAASPVFFEQCCNTKTFEKAALVKRVSVGATGGGRSLFDAQIDLGPLHLSIGGTSAGSRPPLGFLRIDFTDVLITGISWDDGDCITESVTFICKNFKIQYKQQNSDGTLSGVVSPAEWDQVKDRRRNTANPT